jgi:hypothetical protein
VLSGGTLVNTVPGALIYTFDVNWGNNANGTLRHEVISNGTGCTATEDYVITIQALPEADVTGPTTVCGGTQNVLYGIQNIQNGPVGSAWSFVSQLPGPAVATFDGATNLSVVTIDFANPLVVQTVIIRNTMTGPAPSSCVNTVDYTITVNPTPAAPVITGDDGDGIAEPGEAGPPFYVCAGSVETYTLTGVVGGTTTITSVVGGVPSATVFAGVGPHNVNITWGFVPGGGAGSITAIITFNNCPSAPTTMNVVVSPLPNIPTFTVPSPLCESTPLPIVITISNIQPGVTYQWFQQSCAPAVLMTAFQGGPQTSQATIIAFNSPGWHALSVCHVGLQEMQPP